MLDSIHYGAVLTHINALLDTTERVVQSGKDIAPAVKALVQDKVYREIALDQFRLSAVESRPFIQLKERLERLTRITGSDAKVLSAFLDNLNSFVAGTDNTWDDNGYFTVPVVSFQNETVNPGLVYLKTIPINGPDGNIHVGDLTDSPHLRRHSEDYFGSIASVLMNTIYFVNHYPFDARVSLTHHAYRLSFECRITEGKSIGAASLAIFAIAYLRDKLGKHFLQAIAPQRGTLLTGEIDFDGRVHRVDYLDEKITFALNEYGSGLKVIVPDEEHLSPQLERRIDRGNLYYVSNAEELLSAVLSTPGDSRGLHAARQMLFPQLTQDGIDQLRKHLVRGVKDDVFRTIPLGGPGWRIPQSREGIFIAGQAWLEQVEVRLGLEQAALLETPGLNVDKELIELVIDGSEEMEEHWVTVRGGVCNVTAALFEIASAVDNVTQELLFGFLSDRQFLPISSGETAVELEAKLQHLRQSLKLEYRGPFLRPILEKSRADYWHRQKRVFVLSDAFIPDATDLDDKQVSEYTRLRFSEDVRTRAGDADNPPDGRQIPSLFKGNVLDKDLLNRFFRKSQGAFQEVALDFGEMMPLEWQPESGDLSWANDRFILKWGLDDAKKVGIKVSLATNSCPTVQISGQIATDTGSRSFSLDYHLTPDAVKPWTQVESGMLEGEDAARWQSLCTPGYVCPEPKCGATSVHLMHSSDTHILPRCILPSLLRFRDGFLLLQVGSLKWRFFRNGCRINGISFVRASGNLYWSQAKGHLDVLPFSHDTFALELDNAQYYLCRV